MFAALPTLVVVVTGGATHLWWIARYYLSGSTASFGVQRGSPISWTPFGNRVTELLTRMREDIARGDFAAADGDLNAAERVDVQDPAIREARRELARARDAKQKEEQK